MKKLKTDIKEWTNREMYEYHKGFFGLHEIPCLGKSVNVSDRMGK